MGAVKPEPGVNIPCGYQEVSAIAISVGRE